MRAARCWTVEIFLDEQDRLRRTHAEAWLHTHDRTHLVGRGTAQHRPGDGGVGAIGGEIATARALFALAYELLGVAADDIEQRAQQAAQPSP